jgi:hypothetical protein
MTMLSQPSVRPNDHRQRALASTVKLAKEELELLNSIADAIQSSSGSANNGASDAAPDSERPDHLRLLMKKIARAHVQIN